MSMILSLQAFKGANGSINPKLLPDGIGVNALNLDATQGDFRGQRAASVVHTLTGYATQQISLYRMGRDAPSDTAYWLAYNVDADFARSPLAGDTTERTYITRAGSIPAFTNNTYLGSAPYPTATIDLGVPAPTAAMAATLDTAGGGPTETRVYVDTFVRSNGDESAPGISTTIEVLGGSTVDLDTFDPMPSGSHGITLRRIYVSVSGGSFQRCLEIAVASTSATDTGTRGAVLQTGGATTKPAWLVPPDDMAGIIELWNGMLGGNTAKQYLVCVPNSPHAWPVEYRRTVPEQIVGTATWGSNWFIATTGIPRVAFGTTPGGMADAPVRFKQACVSKRSVKGVGHGVCWASNNGLCYHGERGTFILTERLLTKAQWRALVPDTIIGASWGRWYIGFYNDGTRKGFMIDTLQPDGIIWLEQGAYGVFEDTISENLYLLDTAYAVRKWDSGSVGSATFKSKVVRHPYETNPGAARIVASTYPVTFSLWANGNLVVNGKSVTNDQAFRLPGGYVASEFQAQATGTGPIEGVFIGEEVADLP
jgi:hypothetical protein